ncbi:MAG: helix-turn-helix domain-containing protein [Candidatus Sigynarchaeota archaeon]|jgi:hypothetical protein
MPKNPGAKLLRAWRGEMRQVDACKILQIDPATYNRFENGTRRPGGPRAARIEMLTNGQVPASSWYLTNRTSRK